MKVQIKMYWLGWRTQEMITKDINYSNHDSDLILW